MREEKCMFLNIDLSYKLTGIERASLLRAKIFREQLGITPTIVTTKYNNRLIHIRKYLVQHGVLDEEIPVINMYEYFQETCSNLPKRNIQPTLKQSDWKLESVPGTRDVRVYQNGRLIMYEKRTQKTGEIHYINFFHKGSKIRRDGYDCNGNLSVIQLLDQDTQQVLMETYYRTDGTPCITKHYPKKSKQATCIMLLDCQGGVTHRFDGESELITYWLQLILSRTETYYLIIDKNRVYYKPLQQIISEQVHIIPVIHSRHTKTQGDVHTAGINFNYADIFADVTKPDSIVLLTEKQKQDIQKRFGTKGNFHVIPHVMEKLPVPVSFSRRKAKKVIALSRFSEEKNLDQMITMFSRVVQQVPEATLEIYGSGSLKGELTKLIDQLGMNGRIFLKAYVSNPSEIYESAVLSLLTSNCEAFSLVTMESLAHGCPVISYDIKYGPSEMILDGRNGHLVPCGNQDTFIQRIVAILTNPSQNEAMSQQAYELARKFQAGESAKKWRKLLGGISKKRSKFLEVLFKPLSPSKKG
ncbi:glycosyl transferase [Siminovitchia terrae]|uniref:Glycosyl transferase n=1 Tax=Siminovitchia terrae TaxID=1914933 RepID=A0ABQ4KVM2_SIMTE|nr:glycosyltransferase [Siminovitchia terrae]GIN96088.1 glycosyl transferase [Siminovitchia terrae]